MTAPATSASTPRADPGVQWRATQDDLWVARRDGRHLGTVEHGRRFIATGSDGDPIGAYRSLEQAMGAVAGRCPPPRAVSRHSPAWEPLAFVAVLVIAAAVVLGAWSLLLL